jgi:hypothetical protein
MACWSTTRAATGPRADDLHGRLRLQGANNPRRGARDAAGLAARLRRPAADAQQPLAAFRSRTHGAAAAVGYGKSAMVFVMLRDLIGEAAFDRGIQLFWAQNRFRIAGWKELQRAFEQASGRVLDDFFTPMAGRARRCPGVARTCAYFVAQGMGPAGCCKSTYGSRDRRTPCICRCRLEDGSGVADALGERVESARDDRIGARARAAGAASGPRVARVAPAG